jgi:TrmH family RNA methyltransferase
VNITNIKIILSHPSHPANIGAVARAMKNMQFCELILINPLAFPDPQATALACGADDILNSAKIADSFDAAISDCQVVFATSARSRKLAWPMQSLREASHTIATEHRDLSVGIVFGNEQSGLSNEELQKCHSHLYIPSNSAYSSLNLAQAVQLVCYECMMALNNAPSLTNSKPEDIATIQEFNGFYTDFCNLLTNLDFLPPAQAGSLFARIRRLFYRSKMHRTEVDIMRGIIKQINTKL